MLSKLVRIVLWVYLHILYTILENVLVLWVYINLKIKEIRRLKCSKDSVDFVRDSMKSVLKRPQHLVLILDEDNLSYEDLAKLIVWSLAAGVSYFSFYDKTGVLNKNEDMLFEAVQKFREKIPGHIKWAKQPDVNGYKNGTCNKIIVNLLSNEDGKERIVSIVRSICDDVRNGSLDPDLVNVDYLDKQLCNIYPSFPEPNLAIYCGKICRTNGVLPWHIRLTEFLSLGSHHFVKVENFVKVLQNYGQCEQRFGK